MIYNQLFNKYIDRKVQAAIIGAGHFGTAIVTKQNNTSQVVIPIVADTNLENAKGAFIKSNIPEDKMAYSKDSVEAQNLINQGIFVYTDDPMIIIDIPSIEVVCEGTGWSS